MGGTNNKKQFDVLAVGDVVTDCFIRLLDDQAIASKDKDGKWLTVPFGVKIPFDYAEVIEAVGNASNAAVCFSRLGLTSGFVTNVGGDQAGREIITSLDKDGVDTRFVRVNPSHKSNYHYVLWYKEERTILIKHEEYNYHWPHFRPSEIPEWIYFSSISNHALDMHDDIADWLAKHPEVKMAFQPGTFQIDMGAKRLAKLYKHTEVLIVNREEATEISGGDHSNLHQLLDKIHDLGPKIVVITDGPDGAYASDGDRRLKMPSYPDPKLPFDRTGAGDAFSATFVAALMKGSNIEGALQWGPINSMSVVQYVGAQKGLLTEEKLSDYLEKSPDWYRPKAF